jgi:transposase
MAKVEILTGAERQRRWSTELKLSILQEAFCADGTVSDVARRHDVLPQQIYAWRRKFSRPKLKSPEIVWRDDLDGESGDQGGFCKPLG